MRDTRREAVSGSPPPVRAGSVAPRLVLVLVVLLGLMLGIGYLLTRSHEGDAFERVDGALVRWLADHRTPALDAVSGPVAELGNTPVVVGVAVVAAAVAGVLYRSWRPALVLGAALGGELAVFLTTTALIDRARPPVPHLDEQLPPTSSFPSGHTAAAICLYGALTALILAATRGRGRAVVLGCAAGLVVLIAAARLYRGAHYPTDVLASVLFALPWLLVTLQALPLRRTTGRRRVEE